MFFSHYGNGMCQWLSHSWRMRMAGWGAGLGWSVNSRCALLRSTSMIHAGNKNKVWIRTCVTHGKHMKYMIRKLEKNLPTFLNHRWRQLQISRRRLIPSCHDGIRFNHDGHGWTVNFTVKCNNLLIPIHPKRSQQWVFPCWKQDKDRMQERTHQRWVGGWHNLQQELQNARHTHHSTILLFFPLNLTQMMTFHHEWASRR
jgi:hypothetical protein